MVFRSCVPNHIGIVALLAVGATLLLFKGVGVFASVCFEAMGRAESIMNGYTCGSQYGHTCPICMEDYDGEGADVATCVLDYEICNDGACGIVVTSSVWKAALSLYSQQLSVQFTSGLEGNVSVGLSYEPILGYRCWAYVSDQPCGSCEVRYCDASNVGTYADCSNLGQGIFDHCDEVSSGSPGNMLKFLRLPDSCGSGGDAGQSTSGSDAAAAASQAATEASQPTSGALAKAAYVHPLWLLTIGALVSCFGP